MIIDSMLQVSSNQALTGTSLVRSTSHIDLGHTAFIGPGHPLWWVIIAKVGLGGTDTPTIAISLRTDTVTGFGTVETLLTMPALGAAAFATGARIVIPVPWTNKRFMELGYTMTGTSPTATVDAFLTGQEPASWKAFPDGI